MDQPQYTTLVEALSALVDPRKARGKPYGWLFLLTLIAIALASGQRTVHAIADWWIQHWDDLRTELTPARTSCPSESTFRYALRLIDPQGIENLLTRWAVIPAAPRDASTPTGGTDTAPSPSRRWEGIARRFGTRRKGAFG